MKTVLVKEIYNVDTISKGNCKAWLRLMDFLSTLDTSEDIEFDFKGIEVVQPWATPEFMVMMQDSRVHLKFWFADSMVNSINIMCALNGIKGKRAVNVEVQPVKVLSQEDIKVQKVADQLQEYFDKSGEIPVLNIYKRFDQIGVYTTVRYIESAIETFCNNTGAKRVFVETKDITVQPSVIEKLTEIIKHMSENGVQVEIHSNDKEVMSKIGIYQALNNNRFMTASDRVEVIKSKLEVGTVGMLIKYKESKATDEFGRKGKGKPISCRVAIFEGIKKTENGLAVFVRTFNGNTFYTRVHWSLEHDNAILNKLDSNVEVIQLDQFGMYNDFLGSKYHFIAPIQTRKEDTITMYDLNEQGKVIHNNVTIPERIKIVFDDWGIQYNKESLEYYIEKTRQILE